MAWTQTFHDVTESGTVNSIVAEPSGPVRSCGTKKAVSEKSLRSGTGDAGSADVRQIPRGARLSLSFQENLPVSPLRRRGCTARSLARSPRAAFIAIAGAGRRRRAAEHAAPPRPADAVALLELQAVGAGRPRQPGTLAEAAALDEERLPLPERDAARRRGASSSDRGRGAKAGWCGAKRSRLRSYM